MSSCTSVFNAFVSNLPLTAKLKEQAKRVLLEIFALEAKAKLKVEKKIWVACAIYIAVQDFGFPCTGSGKKNPEVTVSQLLVKADINIMGFFSVMCYLKKNYSLTSKSQQSLIALERKYCIVSALYDKFDNIFGEIFCVDVDSKDSNQGSKKCNGKSGDLHGMVMHHKSLCWMLFLVAKAEVLWHRQELLATFHLLLCCMSEVIKATPTFLLIPPFDGIAATSENSLSILQLLSNHVKTKFDEVKIAYNCWLHVAGELIPNEALPQLSVLTAKYNELYQTNGDIDESLFLERDQHLIPQSLDANSLKKSPITSLKRVLDTVQSLNIILKSAPDELSSNLKKAFQKCTKDPTTFIESNVQHFKDVFTSALVEAHEGGNKQLAHQRYKLAARFYYLMLDAMLKMEEERLSVTDFTTLLHNGDFHRSLLACCVEVILMSCGSIGSVNFTPVQQGGSTHAQGILFPWVLKTFELKPFHFFKVIESFIKAAPSITQQIIKHLKEIEEKILESLAWTMDSPIFEHISSSTNSGCFKAKSNPPKTQESMWTHKESLNTSESSPPLSHPVNIFLNKASRLAYRRLENLGHLLEIKNELQSDIWTCIEHVIYKKPHILKDRHLDQIIMCCIYAVCKVLEQDVQFRTIIKSYIQLPHARDYVYKQVLTDGKREFIVVFYNCVFTAEMKDYIFKQFSKIKANQQALNATQSPVILSPSYSIPGRKNFFISPLRQSPFKNPNEMPQTLSQSCNIGNLNQSSSKLNGINETIKILLPGSGENSLFRGRKRLLFDCDNDVDSKSQERESECAISAKKSSKLE